MKVLLLTLALTVACGVQSIAQSTRMGETCRIGERAPLTGSWTWDANVSVELYVRVPDFGEDEIKAMLTAMENWNASASANGSGVRFHYKGTVTESKVCPNCLTVIRGATKDKRHGAEIQGFARQDTQIIDHAWIVINPGHKKSKLLTSIIAHELGHTLGLRDCYTCERGSTAMNFLSTSVRLLPVKIADWSNGITGPTACDIAQVKAAYTELKRFIRPASAVIAQEVVDEGEEPEADDTPIVIP